MSSNSIGTVGFIGFGNMAQAIAQGLIRANVLQGKDMVASAAHFEKLVNNASKFGVKALKSV